MDKTDIPGTFNAGATLGPINETNMTRIWNKHKQTNTPLKRKVFVAMSGGVDSSVAVALLKKQGFEVVGVFFKPWSPRPNFSAKNLGGGASQYFCNWQEDRQDAMRAALRLGIKFKTWDLSEEYGKKVAHYMINGYKRGITPNPDVMCNREIKFGVFLKKALKEGADYIATGHYARLSFYHDRGKMKVYKLLKARDSNKDQSYFLWTLTQEQLKYCLFPIGDYTKPEVRKMAKKFGLANHDKKDSQGVCFVGRLDIKDFLQKYIKPKAGDILLAENGKAIGRHNGAYCYTIGQRHGLDIKNGDGPYFVIAKDIKKNIIYVSNDKNALDGKRLIADRISWTGGRLKLPAKVQVKIRYRNRSVPALIAKNGSDRTLTVKFSKSVRAITPGQSVVFYRGNEVLGGGIIIPDS